MMMVVRMTVMAMQVYNIHWHNASMGNLAANIFELDSGVMDVETRTQDGIDLIENASAL